MGRRWQRRHRQEGFGRPSLPSVTRCKKKEVDKFFESIDDDESGFIEFEELKNALKEKAVKQATKAHQANERKKEAKKMAKERLAEVTSQRWQMAQARRTLRPGMKQNAMERDAADADQDGKLDFEEFKQFVRDREVRRELHGRRAQGTL